MSVVRTRNMIPGSDFKLLTERAAFKIKRGETKEFSPELLKKEEIL